MSAYNDNSRWIYTPKHQMNPLTLAILETTFDAQVNEDIKNIEQEKKEKQFFNRLVLIRTIMFPLEAFITFFLQKDLYYALLFCQKYYWQYLTKKIDVKQLRLALMKSK